MISDTLVLPILGVFVAWVVVAYAIWHWGPGLRQRSVRCPVLKKRAIVLAEQREAEFPNSYGGLKVVDVTFCSLLNGAPLVCGRHCLDRL